MTAPALTIQKVHWRTLLRQRGELVNYSTGALTINDVKVVITRPGEDQIDLSPDGSMTLENKQWDVLIDPDTILDDNGIRIVPAAGHRILRADGTELTVMPNASNRNNWRWSDGLQTWRRVHCALSRDK